jgi:hypothetical protein
MRRPYFSKVGDCCRSNCSWLIGLNGLGFGLAFIEMNATTDIPMMMPIVRVVTQRIIPMALCVRLVSIY